MKTILITTAAALTLAATTGFSAPAYSSEAPDFVKDTFPEQGIEGAWQNIQSVIGDPDSALDGKTKELIALAVSAQIPCDYCIYSHTVGAQAHGATDAEIREALATAGLIRKWSTLLNGFQYDMDAFRQEVDAMYEGE
ncbi:carboxymuconolactone decarboxylase family protein [Halomonas campisalis]|uniref:Carboxymuconolactone decarboxylase family protein n=1 Tax=Billgrantia campisalis TaxID=74661 RepID=A0ABS9PCZ1_9GAMM|nr:carboxymuconolactone decarboxylase family protein [Halomonas campisalis]MCG6658965.1 carboxymuconolactone decarboxylase family protein [Halomonas campisalis]MDR5863686.1 carboxymuconolactone decarboxylase family protein [Halomonas campisalis]